MQRFGTTIVFKEGITKEEAAAALAVIAPFLDTPTETPVPVYAPMQEHRLGPKKVDRMDRRPFKVDDLVHEFDDDHNCWPVFYIP